MHDRFRPALACAAMALVSACVGGPMVPIPSSAPRPAPAAAEPFRAPRPQPGGDVAGIMGADIRTLRARFGEPRIDLVEGDARKLQFASSDCVLDIFLYPLREGAAPVATHVETRLRQGGTPTSSERCISEVERAR